MVNTCNNTYQNEPLLPLPQNDSSCPSPLPNDDINPFANDHLSQQLFAILSKLGRLDADLSELKKGKGQPSSSGFYQDSTRPYQEEPEDYEHETPWWTKNPSKRPHSKVEFPKFEGSDPRGWIMKAEKYFCYYQTPEDLKVDVAAMNFEGDALEIFTWVSAGRTLCYWENLVQILQEHFGPAEFQNPDVYLCSIKQTGTVHEYRQEFARCSSRVYGWPEHCLLGVFINGLKEELQSDVKIQKPRTVYKAASLALEFEAKLQLQPSGGPFQLNMVPHIAESNYNFKENKTSFQGQLMPSVIGSPLAVTTSPQISETDKQLRRDKGLSFRCGDKFIPGHRCITASLKLMELTEDPENNLEKKHGG